MVSQYVAEFIMSPRGNNLECYKMCKDNNFSNDSVKMYLAVKRKYKIDFG